MFTSGIMLNLKLKSILIKLPEEKKYKMDFYSENESGTVTLQRLHAMIRYSEWIYTIIQPFIKGRILEVGCGLGAMTRHLLQKNSPLVSIDLSEWHINEMKKTFRDYPNLSMHHLDFLKDNGDFLENRSFDTVMLINVLEHIEEELETLEKINSLMSNGNSNFILFVPAYQWLFGSLDRIVGHVRRYDKPYLQKVLKKSNFEPVYYRYMNVFGIFGWWLNARILKKQEFSPLQIKVFDQLIPVFSKIEKIFPPPCGQSILVIAKRISTKLS